MKRVEKARQAARNCQAIHGTSGPRDYCFMQLIIVYLPHGKVNIACGTLFVFARHGIVQNKISDEQMIKQNAERG